MSENKKAVEEITSMDENFAKWYTDIVKKSRTYGLLRRLKAVWS